MLLVLEQKGGRARTITYVRSNQGLVLPGNRNEGKSSKANEKLVEGLPVAMKREKKKELLSGLRNLI